MSTVNLSKQTVNLSKGEKINLSKASDGLKKVMIGLGWDPAKPEEKVVEQIVNPGFIARLFGAQPKVVRQTISASESTDNIDCDAWVALLKNGKFDGKSSNIVYYGNLSYTDDQGNVVIMHHGDNLTGDGDGDDEEITIDLTKIPEEFNCILVGVTIYRGFDRHQTFDNIKNTFIRLVDKRDGFEICRYNQIEMAEDKGSYTFIAGELYKDKGEWQFKAMGNGTKDKSIKDAVNKFCYK